MSKNINCSTLVTILAMACVPLLHVRADVIYEIVDYPEEQNGWTLSGTISVLDTAKDDSLLDGAEITEWDWTASKGGNVATGSSSWEVVGKSFDYGVRTSTKRGIKDPFTRLPP